MLVDTSVLTRTLQPQHELYPIVSGAIEKLLGQGRELHIVAQNLIELWVVSTRPIEQNGLGMNTETAAAELERIKNMFVLLPENAAIYPVWESLVMRHRVSGKPAHDARIAAAMQIHGILDVLTFDKTGFSRYPGITVFHPAEIIAAQKG